MTASGPAGPGWVPKTLQRLAFAASGAWGLLLALLALGAGGTGSFGLLGYVAVALGAWLWLFYRALRSMHGRARRALLAIAWSPVWPVAAVVWVVGARRPRVAQAKTSSLAEPAKQPPEQAPLPAFAPASRTTARNVQPLSPVKAALALAGLLLGLVATYAVAFLFFLLWVVLAGIHWFTPDVARFVAIGAAMVAAAGLYVAGNFWRRRAPASRLCAFGWAGLALGGGAVLAITIALVAVSPPRAVRRPSVTGVARVGSLLTARPGRWTSNSGSLGFDYQWQRCRTVCSDIANATGQTYRPRPRDAGRRIDVCVRASRTSLGGLWGVDSACAHSHQTRPAQLNVVK